MDWTLNCAKEVMGSGRREGCKTSVGSSKRHSNYPSDLGQPLSKFRLHIPHLGDGQMSKCHEHLSFYK